MINEYNLTEQLIDNRNSKFWKEVSGTFNPSIVLYDGNCCNFHFFEKKVQFYIPSGNSSIEAFTHELFMYGSGANIFS